MPGHRAQSDAVSHRPPADATHQHNPSSNRQLRLLDSSLNYRKHSTSLFLIDNFGASLLPRPAPARRGEWRVNASTSPKPSSACLPQRAQAGAASQRAALTLSLPASAGRAEGKRTSNRHIPGLESYVSYRKQTIGPISNRHKFAFFRPSILSVDPAAPNSRDYPLAIGHHPLHRGKRS
jgi:hypothetical protein